MHSRHTQGVREKKKWGFMLHFPESKVICINDWEGFCLKDVSLLSHFCIYSIIYVSVNSWIFIAYSGLKFNTVFVFCFKFQLWPLEAPVSSPLWFFFLIRHLFSGTPRCYKLYLCISCPSPKISHLSQKPQFLLLEKIDLPTKIWRFDMIIFTWVSLCLSSQSTEKGNICVC